MTTLREIASDLLGMYRSAYKVTDAPDIRYLYFWIQSMRAKFIKQRLQRISTFPVEDVTVQSLGTLNLENVADPYILGIPDDRFLKRTTQTIPEPIEINKSLGALTQIRLTENPIADQYHKANSILPYISYDRAPFAGSGKFNETDIFAFRHNNRIHVLSKYDYNDNITEISVSGIFLNPLEVEDMTVDSPYPISKAILEDIKAAIMQINFESTMQQIEDKITDGQNNIAQP